MLKTKFGTRLFSLLLVLFCVFALVGCNQDPSQEPIADATAKAQEIHDQLIWDKTAMNQVTANVKGFVTKTKYANVKIAWESDQPDVLDITGKVNRPNFDDPRAVVAQEATETEPAIKVVPVKMTATITAVAEWEIKGQAYEKEVVLKKEFTFTITTVAEGTTVGTIADVKAAAATYIYDEQGVQRELVSNSSVIYNAQVTGVVTAKLQANGAGQFMIHDGTEGIYVYSTLEGLEVGDKVTVIGEIYSYYGALQFGSNISVSIVEKAAGLDKEYRETTPQELEEEGAARNDKGLVKAGYYGGELVNVYGLLVNEAATGGSSDKYHVADAKTGEKLWIYYKSYDADMEATLQQYVGKYVNLRGVTYDRDSRLQKNEILWDGTVEEAEAPTLTDAEKVTVALAAITLPAQAEEDFELVAGEGYVWEVVSGEAIAIEGALAKVTRGEADAVVTLKVTVTVGEASDSKEFEVKVPAAKLNIITIAEALALAGTDGSYTDEKYYIQGIVTEVANDKYGNVYVEDATGKLYVYGMYSADGSVRYDALAAKPQVGDLVTLYGVLGSYNGSQQMKNSWLAEYYDVVTIPEAVELSGTEKNVYTEAKYAIQGTVKEVQNEKYGNIVITDGTNEILIYGTYDYKGNRYDAMEYKPQVGDFVTVHGVLGYYNAAQMKNGTFVETVNPLSTAGLTANALAREDNNYTETLYYAKGVVTEVANTKYGNLYVQDESGSIYVYGLYSADGSVRYDAMEAQPQVGDTVIIRGSLGNYKGTAQLKNAQLIVLTAGSGELPPHEHEFVNGECACGEKDPNYVPPTEGEVTYVTAPEAGVAYYLVLTQENLGKNLYINGEMSGYYYATVEAAADAVQVYLEAVEGGYHMYFLKGEAKTYLNIVVSGTYNNVKYEAAASSVWTFDKELGTLTTVAGENTFFLGTFGTHNTFSACKISYASTNFISHLYKEAPEYVAPEHEHTVCPTCGLCTDPECDGEAEEKCAGHQVEVPEGSAVATFTFGENGDAKHVDGSDLAEGTEYEANGYKLTITGVTKVYSGAYDATGNSCLKYGTGSLAGTFSFTVAEDITKVVIYVAGYKAANSTIKINGVEHSITTTSNNGEYTAITIDTTTTKTISFESVVSSAKSQRGMINTIEFYK